MILNNNCQLFSWLSTIDISLHIVDYWVVLSCFLWFLQFACLCFSCFGADVPRVSSLDCFQQILIMNKNESKPGCLQLSDSQIDQTRQREADKRMENEHHIVCLTSHHGQLIVYWLQLLCCYAVMFGEMVNTWRWKAHVFLEKLCKQIKKGIHFQQKQKVHFT